MRMACGGALRSTAVVLLVCLWTITSSAEEVTRDQIKGLDAQVQNIKNEILGIASSLIQLEEKLLYPEGTRILIFLTVAQGDNFPLGTVNIKIDDKETARHTYTPGGVDALRHGGAQRVYIGNIPGGEHRLEVEIIANSSDQRDSPIVSAYAFSKYANAKTIEISLAGRSFGNSIVNFRD